MWRPGDPRPAPSVSQRGEKEERGRDGEQRKRREKKAPPPKPGGTSQLSNATLGMKVGQGIYVYLVVESVKWIARNELAGGPILYQWYTSDLGGDSFVYVSGLCHGVDVGVKN